MHTLRYVLNFLPLVLGRKAWVRTAWTALRERPIAVCGLGGSCVVDPTFD